MIRINLVPAPERREIRGLGEIFLGLFVLVALFAVIIALNIIQNKKIEDVNGRVVKAEKRIRELEAVKKKVDDFKARNNELNRRIEIINVLERNRTGPLYVMDSLADAIPNKAWIDEFAEKGQIAKFTGVADNEFTVADFMQALQDSPYFVGVELGVIQKTEIRKQDLRNFIISTRLDYVGKSKKKQSAAGQQDQPTKVKQER